MTTKSASIGLINPKIPSNGGSVLRAAGGYGAEAILYTGNRFDTAVKFHTDTRDKNQDNILKHIDDLETEKPTGCRIVCVDLIEGATPLMEFNHPDNALYVFGPEDGSISQAVIEQADEFVYVPTKGCMNLAASVNVVLYDRMAKDTSRIQGDELIRQSRDRNNKTIIKGKVKESKIDRRKKISPN